MVGTLMQGLSVAPRLVLLATGYGLAVVFCALELGQGRGAYFLPLAALALVGLKLEVLVGGDLFKAELRAPAVKE